jgi:NAD(P)H dehydrogenase (quinone)
MSFFAHQGMVYVPLGYKNKKLMDSSEVHGGSAYGAGYVSIFRPPPPF